MSMTEPYRASNPVLLITAAALINDEGQVLVQLRPEGKPLAGLWEFPGGKVEAGESPQAALVRELHEELLVDTAENDLVPFTFASEKLGERDLLLLLFLCRRWSGEPAPLVASELRWCSVDELRQLPMPPADVPLVEQLSQIL